MSLNHNHHSVIEPEFDGRVSHFDFDAVDRGNPLRAEIERNGDGIKHAADGLSELLHWIWQTSNFKFAFARFVAMSAVMRPELFDDQSYHDLGKKMNMTRANISHLALKFQDEFGVHFRRSKRNGARASYRERELKKAHFLNPKTKTSKGRFLPKFKKGEREK